MKMTNKMKIVVGALVDEDTVLIGKRLSTDSVCPDLWELPGGKIEEGETPYDAIIREWKEELDIDINVYYSIPEREEDGIEFYPYIIKYKSGKPKLNVHQSVKWITLNDINKYQFTPLSKKTLYIIKGSYRFIFNQKRAGVKR